nr:odorant-binding protein 7 [Glyphodes caesalis]
MLAKFVYCAFTRSNFGEKDGHVNIKKSLELFPKSVDHKKLKKVMEECNRLNGKTPAKTSLLFMKCFSDKSPVRALL